MIGFFEFIYSIILRREYPLIIIETNSNFKRPSYENLPDRIRIGVTKKWQEYYQLKDEETWIKFLEATLEHEFLHYILFKRIGFCAYEGLDNINYWSINGKEMKWEFVRNVRRNSKTNI